MVGKIPLVALTVIGTILALGAGAEPTGQAAVRHWFQQGMVAFMTTVDQLTAVPAGTSNVEFNVKFKEPMIGPLKASTENVAKSLQLAGTLVKEKNQEQITLVARQKSLNDQLAALVGQLAAVETQLKASQAQIAQTDKSIQSENARIAKVEADLRHREKSCRGWLRKAWCKTLRRDFDRQIKGYKDLRNKLQQQRAGLLKTLAAQQGQLKATRITKLKWIPKKLLSMA